jgi:hypothetical protein
VRALGGDHGHGGSADITGAEAADGFDGHGEEEREELEVICYELLGKRRRKKSRRS